MRMRDPGATLRRQRPVELGGQALRDLRQREAALRGLDQPLPPQALLDRHRVRLPEEQRDHGLELGPEYTGAVMVVGHHALVDLEEAPGVHVARREDAAIAAMRERGVKEAVVTG